MLITWSLVHDAPSTTFLIRLGHQYAAGEHETLSLPAHVDLNTLLVGYKVVSINEKTLSGNQDYSAWTKRRLDWTGDAGVKGENAKTKNIADESGRIILKPMEVRTFEVQVEALR
jgi:hypothetical protein